MRTSLSCPLFLILCNPSSIHIVARVVFSKEEPACVILLIKMKSKGLGVTGKDFHGLATPRFPSRCPSDPRIQQCRHPRRDSLLAKTVKSLPAMKETRVQSLGQEDPLGKNNGNPLQYSCLENSTSGGVCQAIVHGVA